MRGFSLRICITVLFLFLAPFEAKAEKSGKIGLIPGYSIGFSSALPFRAGFDLAVLNYFCSDGCHGYGLVTGVSHRAPYDYYIGVGWGFAYFAALWTEATLNFVDDQFTGGRILGALGVGVFPVLPYIAMGYDKRPDRPYGELGVTLKLPIPLGRR